MSKHSSDLFLLALLNKGVEQDDALVFEESIHVGIAVSTASGAVDQEELGQWELEGSCQGLNLIPVDKWCVTHAVP